jgi:glycosyltransferase involved in cell wall biosynthesis
MINESGIGRYIENLIINLNEIDSQNEYLLFVLNKEAINIPLNSNFKIIEANFKWHGFEEQLYFLKLIKSFKLDLYHSPHPNMPYFYNRKFIITIHDLTMLKEKTGAASTYFYPIYFLKWFIFKIMIHFAAKRSFKIITVSNYVKNQIIEEFGINAEKVDVIYNGVTESITRVSSEEEINRVKDKLSIKKPFLFYVGNAYPHKNIDRLILAFELLNKSKQFQLLLGGKEDYFYKRLKKEYIKMEDIIFGGYLTDREVSCLYSSCEAFVYPSISEGFGIQIIEALKVGTKIICSNNTSFPEIAGKFAFYFNPYDIADIKNVVEKSLNSPNNYNNLELNKHLEKFNWKKSALLHHDIYQKN